MKMKDVMDRIDLLIEIDQQVKTRVEERKRKEEGKPFSEEEMEKIKANHAGWW